MTVQSQIPESRLRRKSTRVNAPSVMRTRRLWRLLTGAMSAASPCAIHRRPKNSATPAKRRPSKPSACSRKARYSCGSCMGKWLVGMPRFELGTSCTPSRRATRLRYIPSEQSTVDSRQLRVYFFAFALATVFFFGAGAAAHQAQLRLVPPSFDSISRIDCSPVFTLPQAVAHAVAEHFLDRSPSAPLSRRCPLRAAAARPTASGLRRTPAA